MRILKRWQYIGVSIAFLCYLIVLFYLLFLSNYRNSVKGIVDYNIIPFRSIANYASNYHGFSFQLLTDNFFGNMLAFLPLGLILPILFYNRMSLVSIVISASVTSLSVECLQFLFRRGTLDVDDIILNTAGAFIGYTIYVSFHKLFA